MAMIPSTKEEDGGGGRRDGLIPSTEEAEEEMASLMILAMGEFPVALWHSSKINSETS